ncbi:hypothetical protein [Kribbella sp. HUAS MG21]|uniref:Uncharacterized protein n=1 Tax=Kribbella sp. HUAS MG21 TaxID=3160966 RepID=A0AAU7TEF0_9ACTN
MDALLEEDGVGDGDGVADCDGEAVAAGSWLLVSVEHAVVAAISRTAATAIGRRVIGAGRG